MNERELKLGVMGGTFDPIHMGHLVAASEALALFELERVLFVPAGQPWQKATYSEAEDRYLMTVLGAAPHAHFEVSRIELDRAGPTYTADTMQLLNDFYEGTCALFFIAGADAVLRLGTWEKLDNLAELADIIAVSRPGFDLDQLEPRAGWPKVHPLIIPDVGVSSSEIRERVRKGLPIDFLVPAEIVAYVKEHGLYRGPSGM